MGNDIYYIGYINKKPQWNVNSVNPLYLMIDRINGHFEEVDGNNYLIISSKNGDIIDGIKQIIKKINDYSQPIKHEDSYMKIKFNTNDNIPLKRLFIFLQ